MEAMLFGAGSHLGVHMDGAAYGAEHLTRDLPGLERRLLMQDLTIVKSHDPLDLRKNEAAVNAYNERMYRTILPEVEAGRFPILLGGDHSVAIASALASQKIQGPLGIIWIDAHTDFNTFDTTETGNIHGLPLAAITGYDCAALRTFHLASPIHVQRAVVVGARAVDDDEWTNIYDAGLTVFTTDDIKEQGVEAIMEQAYRIAGEGTNGIHVSYDLDVIDPVAAPGVSVPEVDGISEADAYSICRYITEHIDPVRSFDLVELNPLRDIDGKTETIAARILREVAEAVQENK
ncbi:MAG: arginase family protein [Clostridiales bacterium]|nr:arginase family protein [Clostridiales bacterium]